MEKTEPERPEPAAAEPVHELATQGQLDRALAQAEDVDSLLDLTNKVTVAEVWARRMYWALEEQNRLAETRIRAARKLGRILAMSIRRGGKSKSHHATSTWGGSSSPLPEGITKSQSSRLQQIASITDDDFERYAREARDRRESMTFAGLVRASARYAAGPSDVYRGATAETYWEGVWDAVTRVMDLDFCVGISAEKLGANESLLPRKALESELSGNVLVRTTKDVGRWLEKLSEARRRGGIAEAMILFKPHTGQAWFRLVESGGWTCCFLEKPACLSTTHALAYLGERRHAFWIVFRGFGAVLGASEF